MEAATVRDGGCNRACARLQPYVMWAGQSLRPRGGAYVVEHSHGGPRVEAAAGGEGVDHGLARSDVREQPQLELADALQSALQVHYIVHYKCIA